MRLETRRPGRSAERGPGPRPARPFAAPERAAGPRIDPAVQLENARRFGHHLGTFGVSVQRPAPAPSPAWIGGPMPSAPIQRVPWWKKGLYGLGGLAGTVAAGAGALSLAGVTAALSPLAVGGLLAGGVGLAGYSAYKALNVANDDRKAVSGAVAETRATLSGLDSRSKKEKDLTERETLLHGLLSDTVPYLDQNTTVAPTTGRSELAFPPPGGSNLQEKNARQNRQYGLRVNPDQGNLPTHILHELIHVDADQKYRSNRDPYENVDDRDRAMPYNTHSDDIGKAADDLSDRVQEVLDVVPDDRSLSRAQKSYIRERLDYAKKSSESEYDTVMSELVYYLHRAGVPETSPTSRAIVARARAARERRNS
ncbi:MAG TPA: hypothetical protein VJ725_21645 [Thermoanaerobaculia bacterium]|nr:hypothetical protein [Thermoanaerobaculia bacterium]